MASRGSIVSASSEGFWALEATPDKSGEGSAIASPSRVAFAGTWGEDLVASAWPSRWAWLAWLSEVWQAGQSPRVQRFKVQGARLQPTPPRGQAGPKRARGTPQNKAMVRPNPINRPRSTRRYPGSSKHAHWLGFSGVAQAAGFRGLWIRLLAQGPWNA